MRRFFQSLGLLIFTCFVVGCDSVVSVQDTSEAFHTSFVASTLTFREDQGPIDVPVQLSQVASEAITVAWGVKSADPSGRCVASGGNITFSPGEQTKNIRVCVPTNNTTYQGTTPIVLQILSISHGVVGNPAETTVRVSDDEPAPFFSFQSAATTRSEVSTTPFQVVVELANAQGQQVIVPLQMSGTATLNQDYTISPNPPNLVFAAGETTKSLTVTIINEATNNFADEEPDETIIITIPQTQDVEPGAIPVHTITILDDDYPALSIANVTASEGTAAPFTATLNRLSTRDVSFNYTTLDGTATQGVEYTGLSGTLHIPAGSSSSPIDVPLLRTDDPGSVGRTLSVQLSAFQNVSNTATITGTATLDRSDLFVPFITASLTSPTRPVGTLAPVRPAVGITTAFARADRGAVRNFDGTLSWAKTNEARFPGLRRVENIASHSRDFADASWTKGTGVTVTGALAGDPLGQSFSTSLEHDGSAGNNGVLLSQHLANAENLNEFVFSIYAKATAPTSVALFIGTHSQNISISGDNTWRRYSFSATLSVAGDIDFGLRDTGSSTIIDGTNGLRIYGAQLENVTWRVFSGNPVDPQLPPSEYISTNVASSPLYHGAAVDGVAYLAYANNNSVDGASLVTEATGSIYSDPPGVLIEGASTNLLLRSFQLEQAPWLQGGGITVVSNAALAPDASLQAETLEDTGSGFATLCQNLSITNDEKPYTLSVYVLKNPTATSSFGMNLSLLGGTTVTGADAQINLATGQTSGSGIISVIDHGPWYRLILTHSNNGLGNTQASVCFFPAFAENGETQVQPGATGTVTAWGAQLEALAFASSYISTSATTVVRATEALTYTPPAGFAVNADYAISARARVIGSIVSTNCASSNSCQVVVGSGSNFAPYLRVSAGGSASAAAYGSANALTSLSSLVTTLLEKTTARFYVGSQAGTEIKLHVGDKPAAAASRGTSPGNPAQLYVGGNPSGNHLYGTTRYFEVWRRRLLDAEARNLKGY